jgi:hypothetical protein
MAIINVSEIYEVSVNIYAVAKDQIPQLPTVGQLKKKLKTKLRGF